jgi:hypothetical protein
MDSDGSKYLLKLFSDRNTGSRTFEVAANGQNVTDTVSRCPFDGFGQVIGKLTAIEMGVAINQ